MDATKVTEQQRELNPRQTTGPTELTAEEKAKVYAKYFYMQPASPDPQQMALMDKPCDAGKAIGPERVNDLLNPGYLDMEIGWCNLPNGTGFIANRTQMPGVTKEMIEWWFVFHALEDLRYKLWYPPQHYSVSVSPETRRKILNPDIPISQKFRGVTHHVVEDIGCGTEDLDINFLEPQQVGFDMARFHEPDVATFVGGYADIGAVNPASAIMVHFYREIPGGLEQRTRFWMGYRAHNNKSELTLPPGGKVPEAAIHGLAIHNVREYTNLAAFLPQIYNEMNGTIAE
jgi:hypothetical protein